MKTTLTPEQSATLIAKGISADKASFDSCATAVGSAARTPTQPIFTLADICELLPKEIIADTIMGKDWPCAFVMRWDENRHLWVTAYETLPRPLDVGNANELIDALYNLLIWAINEKHIEL